MKRKLLSILVLLIFISIESLLPCSCDFGRKARASRMQSSTLELLRRRRVSQILFAKVLRAAKTDVSYLGKYVSNLGFLLQMGKKTAAETPFGVSAADMGECVMNYFTSLDKVSGLRRTSPNATM